LGLLCKGEFGSYNAHEGFKLDPIIRKNVNEELDGGKFLHKMLPASLQLQMVVQELKTKFEHGKFLGAILIVFKDCQEILILTMMILLLVCLSAQLPRFGAAYQSVYQENTKRR
jgi:hypothetical protein